MFLEGWMLVFWTLDYLHQIVDRGMCEALCAPRGLRGYVKHKVLHGDKGILIYKL